MEFENLNIFAVVGDTGVGKTSVLEAITYALYNRCTWRGSAMRDLITKGARAMSVEFIFEANGHRYTVQRRATQAQSQARITCPELAIDTSNANAVTDEIRSALHMDADTFLHTVHLPQGKHAELLTKTGNERNEILKDLFRLKDLDQVAERARRHEARCTSELRQLRAQLADCGTDPQGTVERARDALGAALKALHAASKAVADDAKLTAEIAALQDRHQDLRRDLDLLASAPAILRELDDVSNTNARHQTALDHLRNRLETARKASDEADKHIGALRRAGKDAETLRETHATLCELGRACSGVGEARSHLAEYEKTRASCARDLIKIRASRTKLEREIKMLQEAVKALEADIAARQKSRENIEQALTQLDAAKASVDDAKGAVVETEGEIESLRVKRESAKGRVEAAKTAHEHASDELQRQRTANVAADIARHLHTGDTCPVCRQTLPTGFKAPRSAGLAAAEENERRAASALAASQARVQQLVGQLEALPAQLRKEKRSLTAAEAAHERASRALQALLPEPTDKPEKVLSAHARFLEKAVDKRSQLTTDVGRQEAANATVATNEATLLANIANTDREAKRCRDNIKSGESACAELRAAIPSLFRPASLDSDVLNRGITELTAEIVKAEKTREHAAAAAQVVAAAAEELRKAEAAYAAEVREPRARLLERLGSIAKKAKCPATPESEGELNAWVSQVKRSASVLQLDLQRQDDEIVKRLTEVDGTRQSIRSSIGGDPRFVESAAISAKAHAEEHLKLAQERSAKAESLEKTISRLDGVQAGLLALRQALSGRDVGFPAFAIQQRQRRLVEEATIILAEMTNGRYQFTADMDILDNDSNESRPSQTLSGGEKFLASLALSLAVVEIASNSGSRIDSIFLDEGFDSLDSDKLELAMLELRRRSRAGRMIGVITHIHEVTKFVNETIHVKSAPEGSDFALTGEIEEDDSRVENLVSHLTSR